MRRCSLYMSFAFCILFVFCPMTILVAQSGAEVETEIWTELEKKLEAAAQAQEAARSRKLRTEHRFRYVFSSDLGFLLGLNGPQFRDEISKYSKRLGAYYQDGGPLRYGFSATLNLGLVWPMGMGMGMGMGMAQKTRGNAAGRGPQEFQVHLGEAPLPWIQREPEDSNRHKWSLGVHLRNMISVGETNQTYHSVERGSLMNFFNQKDFRLSYALQPVGSLSLLFTPLWELQFFAGPSLNFNLYNQYREEREEEWLGRRKKIGPLLVRSISTEESTHLDVFSLGAVAGMSLAKYFYSFLAAGISTQFVLNVSPYKGPQAGRYSLGQFVFALYVQVSLK